MTASSLQHHSDYDESKLFRKRRHHLHTIFKTHPCIYGFVLITVVTFDLTELINDWLLYKDISSVEKGLVYGPVNPLIVVLIILVCIIGTVLFTLEILNLIRDFLSGKPWIDRDLISALIVWLEQTAMVAINIVISLCHDEPISYFQLTKMLLACASVILRILIPFLRSYINKKKYSGNERFRNYIYKVVTTAGLCLLLCGSVTFFIFSHIVGSDNSRFNLRDPEEIWEGRSVKEKYFEDVGIYFHHKKFKDYKSAYKQSWIRLSNIIEVHDSKFVFVKVFLQEQNNVIQEIIVKSFDTAHMLSHICFKLEPPTKHHSMLYKSQNCSSSTTEKDFSVRITFKFVYINSQVHLILGDISYKAVHLRGNKCQNLWSNETGIYLTEDNDEDTLIGEILYLKHEDDIHDLEEEIDNQNDLSAQAVEIADTDQFLYGVDTFWTTGLLGCQCTGKTRPTMNTSLKIIC